jgi:drug/metabolite transporter (DMT)-like permease
VLVGFVWPFTIQPYLVSLHGSAFIAMTVSFVPLMTILASVPILGVYPTRRQTIGVLGALACMALLMRDGLDRSVPVWDLCLAISVPACYAVVNTWIRRSLSHVPSLALAAASLGLASGVLLPLSIWNSQAGLSQTDQWPLAWAALACLGVLGTGLAQVLFNKLIQDQGPLFAGMVTNLVPVGAVLWGWSDHEQVTALQLAALVGILAMVTFVQYGAAARRPPPRAPRPEPPRDSNEAQARG